MPRASSRTPAARPPGSSGTCTWRRAWYEELAVGPRPQVPKARQPKAGSPPCWIHDTGSEAEQDSSGEIVKVGQPPLPYIQVVYVCDRLKRLVLPLPKVWRVDAVTFT
jgi:hypothetical protein